MSSSNKELDLKFDLYVQEKPAEMIESTLVNILARSCPEKSKAPALVKDSGIFLLTDLDSSRLAKSSADNNHRTRLFH